MERSWPTPPSSDNQSLYLWALEMVKLIRTGQILSAGSIAQSVASVRVATTANLAIGTALEAGDTVDGVVLATGDLILVKNQTAPEQNGIYRARASGAAGRDSAFNTFDSYPGIVVTVQEGTVGADTTWLCTANKGGTLETTAIPFTQINADMAQATIKGRAAGAGTGAPQDLTGTQVAAILPDSSTTQRGVVELATDAELRSAAASPANAVLAASGLETASALVALTDAATVAVDWDTGINFSLTVTANRAIGNPSNGQIGTWRTILVQGNDATLRTITFGANFLGDVPVITDCTSTKWYQLYIFCVSTSHFVVSSKRAKG